MKKFEYKIEKYQGGLHGFDIWLNERGEAGWSVVHVSTNGGQVLFMRLKNETS